MRVIIVGGGPAGSALALHLARGGVDALVLERARFPRDKACGEFVSPLGVYCLHRSGLLDAIRGVGAQGIDRAAVTLPSGRTIIVPFYSVAPSPSLSPHEEISGFKGGISLPRRVLDTICLQAAEDAGAEVRQGFRVHEIERRENGKGWRVSGRDLQCGSEKVFEGDLLVGADGVGSVVARRLGWLRRAGPQRMGITASFHGLECEPGVIGMHMLPRAYCGMVDHGGGITHIGLAIPYRKGDWPKGRTAEDVLKTHLEAFPSLREGLGKAEMIGPPKAFGPMAVRSRRRAGEGALLVGDAAGFLDPITGHGIGFALRSAELAAETILAAASEGKFSEKHLAAYPQAYAHDLGPHLRLYGALQRVLGLPGPALHLLARVLEVYPGMIDKWVPPLVGVTSSQAEAMAFLQSEHEHVNSPSLPRCTMPGHG